MPTSLGACKPTFHIFYTSHLRWNSTTRRCFYHTHLRQNAVFHNFSRQIALRHSIFRTVRSTLGLLAKPFKKFPKSPIRPAVSHFWQAPNFQWTLKELRSKMIKNLLCLFFYLMVLQRCVILKSIWYARHFEYSCKRCLWTTENKRQSD